MCLIREIERWSNSLPKTAGGCIERPRNRCVDSASNSQLIETHLLLTLARPPTVGRYRGYDLGPSLSAGDRLPRRRAVALLQAWDRALRMAAICAGALRGRIGETQASIALAVRAMGPG